MKKYFVFFLFSIFPINGYGVHEPGPILFSFGHNLIPGRTFANRGIFFFRSGEKRNDYVYNNQLLIGITDRFVINIFTPFFLKRKLDFLSTRGLGDITVEGEWAFLEKRYSEKRLVQATLVSFVGFPTSDDTKKPRLFPSSYQFFVGMTGKYMSKPWMVFIGSGVLINKERNNFQFGNQFLYEGGAALKLIDGMQTDLMFFFELNGIYLQKNRRDGYIDPNSGANRLFFGPAIRARHKGKVFQAGIQAVVSQRLLGNQGKIEHRSAISITIPF